MTEKLLVVENLRKTFGGFVALDGITLSLAPGERLGLIGPNGSGKSTFVNCLSGALASDGGTIHFEGRDMAGLGPHKRTGLGLSRSFQLPRPFHSLTVAQNLLVPLAYTVGGRTVSDKTKRCRDLLGLVGLGAKLDRKPKELTQVEMRKLELARAMAANPKLLIADEALAGLSHSEVEEILDLLIVLNKTGVAVIFIEHIMHAVMKFSERIIVFVAGKPIANGSPAEVIANPDVVRSYLGQ